MSSAILLIAHGSRRATANQDLVLLSEMVRKRISEEDVPIIEIAYLELAEPSIPQGLQACVDRGATSIRMLPYFLSAGAHVSRDLREFCDHFLEAHPQIVCTVCPPLGLHPSIVDVLLTRMEQQFED